MASRRRPLNRAQPEIPWRGGTCLGGYSCWVHVLIGCQAASNSWKGFVTKHLQKICLNMIFRPVDTEIWFNAEFLKSLRHELGWTQTDLSKKSGLSVRVIAKAESGKKIADRTIRSLVNTLREAGQDVNRDDLTFDPRIIVQKFLTNCHQYGRDGVSKSRDFFASNVRLQMDGDPLTNPLAGTYHGIEEFEALLYKFYDIFVRDGGTLGDLTQMRLIGQEVIAWGHEYIRVPEAPLSLPNFTMLRVEFANGLIVRVDNFYESAGLMNRVETWAKLFPHASWIRYFNRDALNPARHRAIAQQRMHTSPDGLRPSANNTPRIA